MPTISIIIPVYNSEKFLRECLDSIIAQAYTDWECILIDDGSIDYSGHICDEYASCDKRFIVIHKPNGGVSSARNKGLELARGTWVSFIDSDDTISQNFFCAEDVDTEADIVLKEVHFSTDQSPETYNADGLLKGTALKDFYSQYLPFFVFRTPWAKLIRREVIENNNIRYNLAYKLGEDTLFVHACLLHVKSLLVSQKGYYIWKPFEGGKYAFPFEIACNYIRDFAQGFFALDAKCPKLAKDMLIWYSSFTTDFTGMNKILWYTDPVINRLYLHAISLFSVSMRAKIHLYHLMSFCRS